MLGGVDMTDYSRARMEQLLLEIGRIMADINSPAIRELSTNLDELGIYQAQFEINAMTAVAPVGVSFALPSNTQVIQAVRLNPLSIKGYGGGKLLESFLEDYSAAEIDMITGAIRQGFFEGKTTSQIITNIIGTRANKYTDGLMDMARRNAETITRTSVQHAAMQASLMAMAENKDVLKGYQFIATLDQKTSAVCRSLDGLVFRFGKGPVPPLHPRCRSRITPALKNEYDWLNDGATRSSADGYVSADTSYYDWLKRQPAEFQDDVIGPARGKLLRNGGLSSQDFARLNLSRNFEPLTLEEMRKKDPVAFRKAGV
jgi:SPP1 gp7 family putative phage head morphogenesis protein